MIGRHIKLIVPSKKVEEVNKLIAEAKEGNVPVFLETLRLHKDARLVSVRVTRLPIRDAQHRLLGISEIMVEMPTLSPEELLSTTSSGTHRAIES